jgi:hypothetical protein
MKPNTKNNLKEFPRPFVERFKETYHNCPSDSEVILCACGNTFHKKTWDKEKLCSQACIYRYSKNQTQVFKEAFASQ